MKEISSGVMFWICEKWRLTNAQLQMSYFKGKDSQGSPAVVSGISPKDNRVSFVILDKAGQKQVWPIPVEHCKFSFGVSSEDAPFPEFAEGKWVSYLSIEHVGGKTILLAERFVDNL